MPFVFFCLHIYAFAIAFLLYFQGIRLSRFQVETLEEVFRRVQFRKVDLEDAFLDDAVSLIINLFTCNFI